MKIEREREKPVQTRLDKAIEWLGGKLSLLFLFIVCISFYEVFMRYLFNSPTIWVHETAAFLGGSLFIFGGAYALATDKHVRVVLLYDSVSPKTRACLNVFHHIMGMVFSAMMTWAGYLMVRDSWFAPWGELRLETSATAWNPAFPAYLKAIIFVSMMLLTVQFTLHLIVETRRLYSGYYDHLGDKDA
ncbi:MAG: C4-dicarboxylate ABC transporter permease [Proteobacteria bacterium]|nr:MAG: C4-dicarboxylate ABC transporter permease [Pseudomonadota bacterium]